MTSTSLALARAVRARVRVWMPSGNSLSLQDWHRRHRVISALVWAHVVAVPLYGLLRGHEASHVVVESAAIAGLAAAAGLARLSSSTRSVMATVGLVTSSAVLTHFSGGLIEMHFHFFVVVAVISLYQSWLPFLVALGFVVAHHGIGGELAGPAVFNHESAVANAWRWAAVHGAFILAESTACLVAWRLNETALDNERRARSGMEKAQAMSRIGSWEWEVGTGTVAWSDELYRIMGQPPDTFSPSVDAFLSQVVDEEREAVRDLVETAGAGGALDFECEVRRPDGDVRILHVRTDARTDRREGRALGTCQDVTERKALEAEVRHRALHDGLTGLPNRALLLDRLDHALTRSRRSGEPLSLLYVDLDGFKALNDNFGHERGDEVLRAVAGRLSDEVRASDTVARLGGDEFAVVLEHSGEDGAVDVATRLLAALAEPVALDGTAVLVRASIGITAAREGEAPVDVLRHADMAMYAAKRQGRHGYRLFTDAMHSSLTARLELEAELASAIERDELVLHYQQLVDLRSGEVDGVEALVRWDHPVRGLLPPSEFIPLAEETGLITELGAWVLRQATADLRRLLQLTARPLFVSVNVAAPQLHSDLVTTVRAALDDAGIPPALLLLEITESCLVSQSDVVVEKLRELRELGVAIAIDDFGTGYSSLSYLRQLPVDRLKIDRGFVRDIAAGPEGAALARSIIKLSETFGLRTVGEGIETEEQAEVLRRLGCNTGQGYLYHRATDLEALLARLAATDAAA